jgi:hypothetical protein
MKLALYKLTEINQMTLGPYFSPREFLYLFFVRGHGIELNTQHNVDNVWIFGPGLRDSINLKYNNYPNPRADRLAIGVVYF